VSCSAARGCRYPYPAGVGQFLKQDLGPRATTPDFKFWILEFGFEETQNANSGIEGILSILIYWFYPLIPQFGANRHR
jgi:hypothetical protein